MSDYSIRFAICIPGNVTNYFLHSANTDSRGNDNSFYKSSFTCYCIGIHAQHHTCLSKESIGGVMVRVITSSMVNRWFESRLGRTKDYNKKVFDDSPLCTQQLGIRAKNGSIGIGKMCQCLFAECCFSELAH